MENGTRFYEPNLQREFTGLTVLEGAIVQTAFKFYMSVHGPQVADRVAALRAGIAVLEALPAPSSSERGQRERMISELVERESFQYRALHFSRVLDRGVGMLSDDFYRKHLFDQYVAMPIYSAELALTSLQFFRQSKGLAEAARIVGVAERRLLAFELCLAREARVHAVISERFDELCSSVMRGVAEERLSLTSVLEHGRAPIAPALMTLADEHGLRHTAATQAEAELIDELTYGLATARTLRSDRGREYFAHPGQPPAHVPENTLLDVVMRVAIQRRADGGLVSKAADVALADYAAAQPIRPLGDAPSR